MRVLVAATVAGLTGSMLVFAPIATATAAAPAPAAAVADVVTANYQMNEPLGATVMVDSSGNGNNGAVNPAGVTAGQTFDGATGYTWSKRSPTQPPAEPQRVVTVADDEALEPGDQDFTLEIRYRTSESYGNVIQKGQATATGGQWKVQAPGGFPSCLFEGSKGQIAAQSDVELKNNQWHVLTCRYVVTDPDDPNDPNDATSSRVDLLVDGVVSKRKVGPVGTLDNKVPMTIGGKLNCDQIQTTCDYFTGQIDYVKIYKSVPAGPVNTPPDAVMGIPTCTLLACSFSSAGSADPDGTIASYAWTFGDGATSTLPNPSRTYATGGTYTVKLTVTDNDGATDTATRSVTVAAGAAPSKPQNLTAVAGDRSATVTWSKPTSAGTSPISGYRATSAPDGRTCSTAADVLTCTVTGLRNEQAYTFTVVAISAAGTSPASNPVGPVTPTGPPIAPSLVLVEPGNRQATVKWLAADGNGSPVTSYVVTQLNGPSQVLPASARSAVFAHLRNGTAYRFSVVATSVRGTSAAASSIGTPAGRPGRPAHASAKARTKAALVRWRAPAYSGATVTRFMIQASNGKRMLVRGDVRHVRFVGLKSGKRYAFRVSASNRLGRGHWSAWSNKVRVR